MELPITPQKFHLPILVELDEDGVFIVSCPVFKGRYSYGATTDEALENIKEAIELCLEEDKPSQMNRFVGFREMEFMA
ncbi:MAG TPA: type II toxin-antitoxin system HicB family antitoxin [Bacteroidia bacterium]|nr:type II toxin-antitoxin system HicB family antitoxin [Bacteroidia bacterium]